MTCRICDNLRFKKEGEEGEGEGVMDHDLVFWVRLPTACERRSET